MKTKKQKIIRCLICIISVGLCIATAFFGYILYRFNCDKSNANHSYDEIFEREQVTLEVGGSGSFKILKINDTHFFNGTCENDKKTLDGIKSVLEKNLYDFIIVEGDFIDGFNLNPNYDKYGAIDIFAKMIENYEIPWAFAPGNNDGEIDGENEDVIAYLMQYEHFVCGNEKGIDGSMQMFIDLNYGGKTVHRLAILDSHSRVIKAVGRYDCIKENQAQWLLNGVNEKNVKTSVFYHMPTNAFREAYDKGEAYEGFLRMNNNDYGGIKNNGVFDDIIGNNENISLLSCAHQHGNNMCSFYNGRYYQLSTVSGYSAFRMPSAVPSVTEICINVNDDNTKTMYTFSQIEI